MDRTDASRGPIRYEALDGKHCVLTGATAGIGRAAATALVRAGAGLTIVARSAAKAEAVRAELARSSPGSRLDVVLADFASLSQVRRAAAEILERTPRIDVLFNNAGVINLRYSETEDGYETTFAVNHLGPFLFTNLLQGRLCETPGARIVMTASDAHKHVRPLDFDDLHLRKKYSVAQAYGRSKAANILFIQELARRLAGTGVTANSFHPGFVRTDMGANHGPWAKLLLKVISPFANSPEKGADTGMLLATAPELAGQSGGYYANRKPVEPAATARGDEQARRLWEVSEAMTGLTHAEGSAGREWRS